MQPVDLSSQAKATVSFIVTNSNVSGAILNRTVRLYADYDDALKVMKESDGYSSLKLVIAHPDQQASEHTIRASTIPAKIKRKIREIWLSGDHFRTDLSIKKLHKHYPQIHTLYVENLTREGCAEFHRFENLSTLEINNSGLIKALRRGSQFEPSYSETSSYFFPEDSLQKLSACKNLKALKLTKVRAVSASVDALKVKMPFLEFNDPKQEKKWTPSYCAKADVTFYIEHHKFSDKKVTVISRVSKDLRDARVTPETTRLRVHFKIETANGTWIVEKMKTFNERAIDPYQVRACTFEGDLAFFYNANKVVENLKNFPKLKQLTLHNATKKALAYFQGLSQVKTLAIDNSELRESIDKLMQTDRDELTAEDIAPVDDEALSAMRSTMKKLKRVHFIDVGTKPHIVKQERDGKDEKEVPQAGNIERTDEASSPKTKSDCYHSIMMNYNNSYYKETIEGCEEYLRMVQEDAELELDMRAFQIKAHILYILVSCHFELQQVSEKTKVYLDMALKLFAKFTDQHLKGKLYLLYGDYLAKSNQFEEAADAYRKAQKMKLDDTSLEAKSHFALGQCLQKLNSPKEAVKEEYVKAYRLVQPKRYKSRDAEFACFQRALHELGITIVKKKNGHTIFETQT